MESGLKRKIILLIYFLSPVIASIIDWYQQPAQFSFTSSNWITTLTHHTGSILGVFSYIWMCFNIVIMIKIKGIEKNTEIYGLLNFHTLMAVIALLLGFAHMSLLLLTGGLFLEVQILSGLIGLYMFLGLMVFAIIFMSNRLIKSKGIQKLRAGAYKMDFKYSVNKFLHNITMLAVFIIFIHTLLSFTARGSMIMTIIYFIFFDITIIGWITHKVIRKLSEDPDPYAHRKALWDAETSRFEKVQDKEWVLEFIKEIPSIYPCIQCGTCTSKCPVSELTGGDYNPRQLIKNSLLGLKDKLYIEAMPNVWECTQCYTCYENCPQHVELPEVFIYLRNSLAEQKKAPDEFLGEAKAVYDYGKAVPSQPAVVRRRAQLGLPAALEHDLEKVQYILEISGLNLLFKKDKMKEGKE
jgi:heterodisulfide reductase subunit C